MYIRTYIVAWPQHSIKDNQTKKMLIKTVGYKNDMNENIEVKNTAICNKKTSEFSQKNSLFWMSVAPWFSGCFCAVLCVCFCMGHFVMVPWTWHVYIVYNILSLNIFQFILQGLSLVNFCTGHRFRPKQELVVSLVTLSKINMGQ